MRIVNQNNFNTLNTALNQGGWCYSRDGIQIEVALTTWEKVCYLGRTLIFSNGSNNTLESAIIDSFSAIDRAIIKNELSARKIAKNYNIHFDQELKPSLGVNGLLSRISSLSNDVVLTRSEGQEVSLAELSKLAKIHNVFKKIHHVAEKIEVHGASVNQQIEKRRKVALTDEFKKLVQSPNWGGYSFQKEFRAKELMTNSLVEDLVSHNGIGKFEGYIYNLSSKGMSEIMGKLIEVLDKYNLHASNIVNKINAHNNPSEDLLAFRDFFAAHSQELKRQAIGEAISEIISIKEFVKQGHEYGRAITFALMGYSTMIGGDFMLFREAIEKQIKNCMFCYNIAQRFPGSTPKPEVSL